MDENALVFIHTFKCCECGALNHRTSFKPTVDDFPFIACGHCSFKISVEGTHVESRVHQQAYFDSELLAAAIIFGCMAIRCPDIEDEKKLARESVLGLRAIKRALKKA